MATDLARPADVGTALLTYLKARTQVPELSYAHAPEAISHGWETYIYRFQLGGERLPPEWTRPLILRVYPGKDQGPKAEQEANIQRFAAERGYPAPRPLTVETGRRHLGRPFMIMEQLPGVPMLERVAGKPIAALRAAGVLADAHARLHRIPTDGCPLPTEGALVERRLADLATALETFGTDDMQKGLSWLQKNQRIVTVEETTLCHGDFHPLNVLVDDEGTVSVVDWPAAALGDRHSDIANSLVMLRTAPIQEARLFPRLMARFGRDLFARLYLRHYRRLLPLDDERLRYWEAERAFEWWVSVAALLERGPGTIGARSDIAERVPDGHSELLRRYFWERARG